MQSNEQISTWEVLAAYVLNTIETADKKAKRISSRDILNIIQTHLQVCFTSHYTKPIVI